MGGSILTLGHNCNKFGGETLDVVVYIPTIKDLGLVVFDKKIFLKLHFENLFLTPWPIPVEFGQNTLCSLGGEVR